MTFMQFTKFAEEYLVSQIWRRTGSNGLWPMLEGFGLHLPLPGAIKRQLEHEVGLEPHVESYLQAQGWVRVKSAISCGMPIYRRNVEGAQPKKLSMALLEQLRIDITSRESSPTVRLQMQILSEVSS